MSNTSTGELTSRMGIKIGKLVPGSGDSPPRLVVLLGHEPGRRYNLNNQVFVVGRSEDCDIQIDDTKVSRRHIRIQNVDGTWLIEDLASRNGTMVNGEVLQGPLALNVGDRIQLPGETLLLFTRQDPLEDLLLHRQQMEVIGHLAAGIAHDFNNLLNVITASSAHIEGLEPSTALDDSEVRECHADILAASQRAAELTARLLTIARRRDYDESGQGGNDVDVTALCADVLQLVGRTFDRSIQIESDVAQGLTVRGDQASLHQVMMNLCINARDAMPDGGTLAVTARREEGEGPQRVPHVLIEVTDTGSGMDEETRARVFEPFFTTKEQGAGSGLGLATVYEVATNHGGIVDVESEPGAGSTFRVRLPLRAPSRRNLKSKRERRMATWDGKGGGRTTGRVLVVDDQELVRRSLGRLLRAQGHEVTFAVDGRDALAKYADESTRPEVVLMDFDMPYLSGGETLVQIRELDPTSRVILMSGYCDDAHKRRLIRQGATDFLAKPVDVQLLLQSISLAFQMGED